MPSWGIWREPKHGDLAAAVGDDPPVVPALEDVVPWFFHGETTHFFVETMGKPWGYHPFMDTVLTFGSDPMVFGVSNFVANRQRS